MNDKDIKKLWAQVSRKYCMADYWINEIYAGRVRFFSNEEQIINDLNGYYNNVFDGINLINERYTGREEEKYWVYSYLKVLDGILELFFETASKTVFIKKGV